MHNGRFLIKMISVFSNTVDSAVQENFVIGWRAFYGSEKVIAESAMTFYLDIAEAMIVRALFWYTLYPV